MPGVDPGVGNTGHIPPPSKPSSYLPALVTYLLSRECKKCMKFKVIQQLFLMKEPLFLALASLPLFGIFHHEMPKVGVVNHLRMRVVHNLVKFPPPLRYKRGGLLFIIKTL